MPFVHEPRRGTEVRERQRFALLARRILHRGVLAIPARIDRPLEEDQERTIVIDEQLRERRTGVPANRKRERHGMLFVARRSHRAVLLPLATEVLRSPSTPSRDAPDRSQTFVRARSWEILAFERHTDSFARRAQRRFVENTESVAAKQQSTTTLLHGATCCIHLV